MSMADDNTLRSYRSNDPYRRAAEPARPGERAGGSDPLAELARLIGQTDPFAEFERNNSRAAQPADYRALPRSNAPGWPAPEQRYADSPRGGGRETYQASEEYVSPLTAITEARQPESQYYDDRHHYDDRHRVEEEQFQTYADDRTRAPQQDEHQGYYQDDAPIEPHEDEMYDDAPRARRRGGLATLLAFVGCALVGTAGAYAYRSYSAPTSKEPPPVITADTSMPTKIVPAAPNDATSNKQTSDRFANVAGSEQLVSRQEEPVALREPGTPSAPRVVLPAPVPPAPASQQPAAGQPSTGNEPKKIRTVTIRPDGSDPSGRPVGPATGTTTTTPSAARAATPPAPRAAAPARNSNGPLSLDPQSSTEPRARVATTPAAREPTAYAPASSSYLVQLSSQKTESEAQASFRSLQAKFPNELGNRQVIIRRADLGAKGVVYRTNVGPFASAHEAQQFCASYKAAGGQCLVPTN